MKNISDRVADVRRRIAEAAKRAGRAGSDVSLMAAVKTRSHEEISEVVRAGVLLLGENRVQEAVEHSEGLPRELSASCRYHFIGRLQSNKARRAVELFDSIDSVDSEELAARLQRVASEMGLAREVMIEINLCGEGQKGGIEPGGVARMADFIAGCGNLKLSGVMGIPPLEAEPEINRPHFARLKKIYDDLASGSAGTAFRFCSMGMTQDLEVAIEEGSNLVRVGTALFGPR